MSRKHLGQMEVHRAAQPEEAEPHPTRKPWAVACSELERCLWLGAVERKRHLGQKLQLFLKWVFKVLAPELFFAK